MTRLAAFLIVLVTSTAYAEVPDFERDIFPILKRHCFECHGPQLQEGDLRFDNREAFFTGGASGPAVIVEEPDNSELLRRVLLPADDSEHMPASPASLTASEITFLRNWITNGAHWPEDFDSASHWAYLVPTRPDPPDVSRSTWPENPIDRFILDRLDAEQLPPSPQANKATLLRRVSLDLIGLPPSPAELDAFLSDDSPDAYERTVDRLLASPAYGEKWTTPWLDLARYADSHGFQRDDLRSIWPYRDWVIRALNANMPFDQFTIEQIAGDLLSNPTPDQLIATGFHRCTTTNVEAGSEPEETRVNQVLDRVNTTATVWLGTTLECAQCHDHKYDPFSQEDYYRLFAFFNSTEIEADRSNPKTPGSIRFLGPTMPLTGDPDDSEQREKLAASLKAVDQRIESLKANNEDDEATKPFIERRKKLAKRLEGLKSPTTLVMKALATPRETYLFSRGVYTNPEGQVTPATPAVLPSIDGPANRLTLAKWLVSPENPLTARVVVNRWWLDLFGRGLVTTPEDFGAKGALPSHPGLLDWLAVEFMESGWDQKHILRLIVTSATYRQSSRISPDLLERDPGNEFYARGPRFRLDAETIRDQALAVASLLSHQQFGEPIRPFQPEGLWAKVGGDAADKSYVVSKGEDAYRRGVYVVWKRSAPYPSFVTFDANARLSCTVERSRSNTPLQALVLLNDPVYVEVAFAVAARIVNDNPHGSLDDRLRYAVTLCLCREPNSDELTILRQLFEEQHRSASAEPERTTKLLAKTPIPAGTTPAELAAWYAVASAILNLDEAITKE